jgi:hypothetical protein
MKSFNKLLIGLATVTTIIAPLVPKTVNLNVSLPTSLEKHRSTECRLSYKTLNSHGLICGYKCDNGKNANMPNKDYNSPNDCSEWITIE